MSYCSDGHIHLYVDETNSKSEFDECFYNIPDVFLECFAECGQRPSDFSDDSVIIRRGNVITTYTKRYGYELLVEDKNGEKIYTKLLPIGNGFGFLFVFEDFASS